MAELAQLIKAGNDAGFIVQSSITGVAVNFTLEALSKMDFWCGNNTIHEENPEYHKIGCCFTHVVGLPRHPATQKEMPLTPYQVDFVKAVFKAVTNPGDVSEDEWARLHHAFHVLKGRQMGFTEIVLRVIQFFCFNRYAGQNVGIIAATNGSLANKDLRRFYRLFHNIPGMITGPPTAPSMECSPMVNLHRYSWLGSSFVVASMTSI